MDQILASWYANQNMVSVAEDVLGVTLTLIQAKHFLLLL
jgi:hypothetical protein